MGQAKAKKGLREQFFIDHPMCCFCGGMTAATTQDHFPPRTLFRERKWPEGYVFPACEACNRATRKDEQLLGLILRFSNLEPKEIDHAEFRTKLNDVKNNFPGILEMMRMSVREKRRASVKLGLSRLDGQFLEDLPIVKYPKEVEPAIQRFMFKLACALHYFHVGKPLGATGQIVQQYRTNAMLIEHGFPVEITQVFPGFAKIERTRQPLHDQFTYRYGILVDQEAAAFNCVFWKSSIITIVTAGRPTEMGEEFKILAKGIEVDGYLRGAAK